MRLKQIHVVVYLESKNCEVVRIDKKGYYVMRNLSNGKISGVPVPREGSEDLDEVTISLICKNLRVESPPNSSPEVEELITAIDEDVKRRYPDFI